jgi:hypothetical protein
MEKINYKAMGIILLLWIFYDLYVINSKMLYLVNISSIKDLLLITSLVMVITFIINYFVSKNVTAILNKAIFFYSILIMIWWANIYKFTNSLLLLGYIAVPVFGLLVNVLISTKNRKNNYSFLKELILSYIVGLVMMIISFISIYVGILLF